LARIRCIANLAHALLEVTRCEHVVVITLEPDWIIL
jgi:hypothetical protein